VRSPGGAWPGGGFKGVVAWGLWGLLVVHGQEEGGGGASSKLLP